MAQVGGWGANDARISAASPDRDIKEGIKTMRIFTIAILLAIACSSAPELPQNDEPCHTGQIGVCPCPGWPEGMTECNDGVWLECVCETREISIQSHPHDHIVEHEPRPPGPYIITETIERGGAGGMIGFTAGRRF